MNKHSHNTAWITAATIALCGAAAMTTGCRGGRDDKPPRQFFPDLDEQMKWKPQGQSEFFADGRMMRKPVAGAVPFGRVNFVMTEQQVETKAPWARHWMEQREDFLKADDAVYAGKGAAGEFVDRIPMAVTRPMLDLGKKKFNIYCAACHGYLGDGKGMVGKTWSYALPNFHDDKYLPGATEEVVDEATKAKKTQKARTGQDGYIFSVARNGVYDAQGNNKMPAYGHALSERDAWAVVAYIRALQEARGARLDDPGIPEAQREALGRSKPAPAPAPTAPAPSPAPSPAPAPAPANGGSK